MVKRDTWLIPRTQRVMQLSASNSWKASACEPGSAQAGASFMRNAFSRRAMAERYLQVLHDAEVTAPEQAEALRVAAA